MQRDRTYIVPARRARGATLPPLAAALPHCKAVDFFPWTDTHPEDLLNEHVIEFGYSKNPHGSDQTGSHTARPSLWLYLRNEPALPLLFVLSV